MNQVFPIYDGDGESFLGLELRKSTVESVVMSLADKITGDVLYRGNDMPISMREYIIYNDVKYVLVNPPTIVRNGLVADNSDTNGLTRYSFEFYHPMYQLSNLPFCDVAVSNDEKRYLSENKSFYWIGYPSDFKDKLNKNLENTWWKAELSGSISSDKLKELSSVIPFDNNTIADALKAWYDTWELPYVIDQVEEGESGYSSGKRFKVVLGYPSNEIYGYHRGHSTGIPYVFRMGQGVGLKNNSRTPRNNKIVTRISGYGSEDNIPYGYPQIEWKGDPTWEYTIGNSGNDPLSYPIYDGIVNGRYVKLIKHPFTRTHLMPSCYTEAVKKKVDPLDSNYDPDIELVDYYDAVGDEYLNEINPLAPSYESHAFEDVKPELGEEHLLLAYPVDANLEMATEWDDTMDENGNYVQSYFKVKLPRLGFDLYACAAITQSMKINMRSGACLGCTFDVQVDWESYKLNFYDTNGNFAPSGSQRNYTIFPDSSVDEIEVVLKKEIETFGTLMPNRYQTVKSNDQFVLLGISLPLSYITDAEKRLDEEMKAYMKLNNIYYFDYPLKVDEAFLYENPEILAQIRPNSIVRFMFAETELQLFVKQLSIKYGEKPLPQYDITLTDNIEVATSPVGKVSDSVDKLAALIAQTQHSGSGSGSGDSSDKLSRLVDDEAHGLIGFIRGAWFGTRQWFIDQFGDAVLKTVTAREEVLSDRFVTSNYTDDSMFGTGGLFQYLNGKAKLVTDMIVCRGKFIVNEIEDRIWTYSGGNLIFSAAGSTIFYVEYLDANGEALGYTHINSPWLLKKIPLLAGVIAWSKRKKLQRSLTPEERARVMKFRCYETSDDGTMQTRNWWHLDDIAMCQTLNRVKDKTVTSGGYSGSLSNTVYLRRVIGIGSKRIDSIDLDRKIYDYVDLSLTDCDPDYNDWPAAGDVLVQRGNKTDTERQGFSTLEVTGQRRGLHVYDNVSGYTMEGKDKAFIGYNSDTGHGELEVFGNCYIGAYGDVRPHDGESFIRFDSTTKLLEIKAKISALSTIGEKNIGVYVDDLIHDVTDLIQNQVDKKVETWYQDSDPSTAWTTASEKALHVGDMWYKTLNGENTTWYYKATTSGGVTTYAWVQENISKEVFDTIDGKAAVYTTWNAWMNGTTNNLRVRDLFIPTTTTTQGGVTYTANKVYRCVNSTTPSFREIEYTDDSSLQAFITGRYATDITGLSDKDIQNESAAGKAQQDAFNAQELARYYESSNANLIKPFFDGKAADGKITPAEKDSIKQFIGGDDGQYDIIISEAAKWNVDTTAMTNAYTAYKAAIAKYTAASPTEITIGSDYQNIYGFYTAYVTLRQQIADKAKEVADTALSTAQTANAKADAMEYIKVALGQKTDIDGGLILTSLIALRDGSNKIWSGINGVYNASLRGGGIAAWYGGGMVDHEAYPSQSNYAKTLFRMDGTGYMAGGNISWDANGNVTVAGDIISASTKIDTPAIYLNGVNITSILNSILSMFELETQSGRTVIKAKYALYSVGDLSARSDKRTKNIIDKFNLDIDAIAHASLVKFTWKGDDDKNINVGGIAQEWQKILPEAVHEAADGTLLMDYGSISLASAVSLAQKVVEQQKSIDDLEKRIERLERIINAKEGMSWD